MFLNPWMLLGLAGIALPILAHLLSRKKYDILEWGAMQFLELDPNARRKLRLEDLLLLLVRIGLIALLALALSRPWISGAWLGRFGSHQSRDVAIVIDGSYSMGWQGANASPEKAARQFVQAVIDDLYPGDTITVFDARDQTRLVIGPTRDFRRALQAVEELPPPSGSSHLAGAVLQATQTLTRTTNLQRDVVILSDRQAKGWQPDDLTAWKRLDELRTLATVPVRIFAADVSPPDFGQAANLTVERLKLSREVTVPDAPLRVKTKIRQTGGKSGVTAKVYLALDGERLNDQTLQVRLPENGEVGVEFEPRLTKPGSHLISVSVDPDPLSADDRSDAVVLVRDGLPVLLINGTPANDPVKRETFFAEAALSASDQGTPWIRATVQNLADVDFDSLSSFAVIVLANVPALDEAQAMALESLVRSAGRSVLITGGDQIQPDIYNSWFAEGRGWLPCRWDAITEDTATELRGVHISNESLELPWLLPFRTEQGGTLTEARFSKWWKIRWQPPPDGTEPAGSPPVQVGRLNTGDPWLMVRKQGRGSVAVLASTLDADWNTLPAKSDFVPWLHELLFFLSNSEATRNVDLGQPLVLNVERDLVASDFGFRDPLGKWRLAERGGDEAQRTMQLPDPDLPGVYRFEAQQDEPRAGTTPEYFVVQADRSESDLTPLTEGQQAQLTLGDRMTFVADAAQLTTRLASDSQRAEIWWIVLYIFLGVLIWETWLTRQLVKGGQRVLDTAADDVVQPAPATSRPASKNRRPRRQKA